MNWHSRSFKVNDFCCNRKPIYDFLVINCHLSSISHRFWDIASRSRKPPHPSLSPRLRGPSSNFVITLGRQRVKELGKILVKTAWSAVLSRYTRVIDDRQTTYYDKSRTLQWNCNVRLKSDNLFFALCLSNINHFSKKIGTHVLEKHLTKLLHKVPTLPKMCASTTLGNLKWQIEPSTR